MSKEDQTFEELTFHDDGSMGFKMGLARFVSGLGILFIASFLFLILYGIYDGYFNALFRGDFENFRLTHADFEMLGLPLAGIVLMLIGRRQHSYFREARIRLTQDTLYYHSFWRVRQWKLADIQSVSTKLEKMRKNHMPYSLVIEWIILELKNGRSPRFIAPRFYPLNGDVYAALSERLQMPIERDDRDVKDVPRGFSPFGLFNIKHFIERF